MNDPRVHLQLSTSAVAGLLRVHPSTVKRWAEEGSLNATRTVGGHRRFDLRGVVQRAHAMDIPTFLDPFHPWEANVWGAIQAAEKERDFTRLTSLGLSWLRQGNTELLGRLFFEVGRRDGIPFTRFIDQAVAGFMAKVGEEWIGGRLQVGEEHMATEMILEALIRLRLDREDSGRPPMVTMDPKPVAVVGTAEGGLHVLGAQAIRSILEERGWRVYYLGANVPLDEFSGIQKAQAADLVCISFSSALTRPDLTRAISILERHQDPRLPHALALAGRFHGITAEGLPEGPFTALTLAGSAEHFQEWLDSEFPRGEPRETRKVA